MQIEKYTPPTSPPAIAHNHRFHERDKWHLFIKRPAHKSAIVVGSVRTTIQVRDLSVQFRNFEQQFLLLRHNVEFKVTLRRDVTTPYKAYSRLEAAESINICRVAKRWKKIGCGIRVMCVPYVCRGKWFLWEFFFSRFCSWKVVL